LTIIIHVGLGLHTHAQATHTDIHTSTRLYLNKINELLQPLRLDAGLANKLVPCAWFLNGAL